MTGLSADAKIVYAGVRRCFYRSEAPSFSFHLFNFIPHSLKNCKLTVQLGPLPAQVIELPGIGTNKRDLAVTFPAGQLKHGWYELRAELTAGEKTNSIISAFICHTIKQITSVLCIRPLGTTVIC